MQVEGTIHPVRDAAGFTCEAWCQLVASRPEFRRYPPRQARNPFTGGMMTIRATPDAAEVIADGRAVGKVYWSMSDEPMVNVSIEPSALPLVREWAVSMGGEFRPDSPESSPEPGAPDETIQAKG
jgi:hypothetical protein